ncbi:PIG-L family deacetylase (plasmid) [Pseudorhodobacter turbinis]|uniref:PIG-L family deacetylase n=1 Tax=Pseudorhodobacter turbinis TaxID=2500533 RepID=A0A4P8EJ97_9RHOB|nr:PIG-L family deacetylase [Pseudorhodobacter turbinis]QCO57029.1 PIG-L family deacetylase [Pseudorhodobacter turbinis]
MPLTDAARIAEQTTQPAALMLWRALQPLRGLARFMNSGAHPDDEISTMLAALTYRDGLSLSYVCSTRGEGGQNDIGREAGADLGTLRTAEMHAAADILGLSMYWLSDSPDDPIVDFGFSKSGVETLGKWGHAHTLRRLVGVIRKDRPDILCPTFLDIPGQHGHHRAMTQAAHEAMTAAADPDFIAEGAPWQVAKLYLPAWSGAGDAYDDDLPPPPATVHIPGAGREPVSGWTWAEIGQQSRVFHATQGMGRWTDGQEPQGWSLHLAQSHVGGDRSAITDNLPQSYAALLDDHPRAQTLDGALAACITAFPDTAQILHHGFDALSHLRALRDTCPEGARDQTLHRLDRTEAQLARVLWLASGARLTARLARIHARPGEHIAAGLTLQPATQDCEVEANWHLPAGWQADANGITPAVDAHPFDPYPMVHHAHAPQGPVAASVTLRKDETTVQLLLPIGAQVLVLPKVEGEVEPQTAFLNTTAPQPIPLRLSDGAKLTPPKGWALDASANGATLTPQTPTEGLYTLPLKVGGQPAQIVTRINHPHTGALLRAAPAALRLRVAEVALAPARIAYIGGGNDRVDHWLRAMGADVTTLGDAEMNASTLADFDTLVIGIFAMRFRPALPALMPTVHDWVAKGGTLLTLYHRPWDNWTATTAPRPLEIGKPSLRYRVTDENAAVTHLIPEHPLLNTPNQIGPQDWEGWVKERGLYFAKSWDSAYQPVLQMADEGEAPHQGALLSARIGKGQHHHCALILHLQMEALIPGAFRLMANLIAPPKWP